MGVELHAKESWNRRGKASFESIGSAHLIFPLLVEVEHDAILEVVEGSLHKAQSPIMPAHKLGHSTTKRAKVLVTCGGNAA